MRHSRCASVSNLKCLALGDGADSFEDEARIVGSLPKALKAACSMNCTRVHNNLVSGGYTKSKNSISPVTGIAKILFSILTLLIIVMLLISNQSICHATQIKRAVKSETNNNNNNNNNKSSIPTANYEPTNCHHHHTSHRPPIGSQQANEFPIKGEEPHQRVQNRMLNSTIAKLHQHHQEAGQLKGGSSANDVGSKQSANRKRPPHVPASPSHQQATRNKGLVRDSGCSGNGDGKCHNKSPAKSISRSGRSKNGTGGCSGCLRAATSPVPLSHIGGGGGDGEDKREIIIDDLIIPQKQDRQRQQQQSAYHRPYYATNPEATGMGSLAYESRQPSYYPPQGHINYNYHPPPPAIGSLGPHSNEKCPMTGPMTICDQVGSYPVDIILSKLDGAKRILKQSYFNLDSLFSDERDHSSDPFEFDGEMISMANGGDGRLPMASNGTTRTAPGVSIDNFSHTNVASAGGHYGPMNYAISNYVLEATSAAAGTGGVRYGIAGSSHHEMVEEKHQPPPRAGDHRTVEGGFHYDSDKQLGGQQQPNKNELNPARVVAVRDGTTGERGWLDTDEFVNLVKHRSISIRSAAAPTGNSAAAPPTSGGHRKQADNGTTRAGADYHYDQHRRPGAIENGGLPIRHHDKEVPLVILGEDLADKLLSIGDSLSKYSDISKSPTTSTTTHNTDRSYQSYQVALLSATSGNPTTPIANFNTEPTTTTTLAGPSPSQWKSRLRKRPRRQVGPPRSFAATSLDPERISEAANGGRPPPEPVCRAKSIYISPRAALNDKKQWKYVVNAPERDPQIRQIVRVDICEDPLGPCSDQFTVPFGFTSQCKQKYSKKKLLALDSQSGLLEVDTFFIPSCCVCQLVRDRLEPEGDDETDGSGVNEDTPATNGRANLPAIETATGPPGEPLGAAEGPTGDSTLAAEDPEIGFGPETSAATAAAATSASVGGLASGASG